MKAYNKIEVMFPRAMSFKESAAWIGDSTAQVGWSSMTLEIERTLIDEPDYKKGESKYEVRAVATGYIN